MAGINEPFELSSIDPLDSRTSRANRSERLAFFWKVDGMEVYQRDTKKHWKYDLASDTWYRNEGRIVLLLTQLSSTFVLLLDYAFKAEIVSQQSDVTLSNASLPITEGLANTAYTLIFSTTAVNKAVVLKITERDVV